MYNRKLNTILNSIKTYNTPRIGYYKIYDTTYVNRGFYSRLNKLPFEIYARFLFQMSK